MSIEQTKIDQAQREWEEAVQPAITQFVPQVVEALLMQANMLPNPCATAMEILARVAAIIIVRAAKPDHEEGLLAVLVENVKGKLSEAKLAIMDVAGSA